MRQIFAEALEQVIARHASLRHERVDLFRSKSAGQIVRRYCLIGASADPRISGIALASLLKLFEQVAQAAAQDASSGTGCEQTAQPASEQIAQPAARQVGIDSVSAG